MIRDNADVQTAVALAWAQFQADTKLTPDDFTDTERMAFQAGFVSGMHQAIERIKARIAVTEGR